MRHGVSICGNPSKGAVNIRIKVQNGTLADKFLCETCTYGTIMRGPSLRELAARCSAEDGPPVSVPFRVVQCNKYNERDSTNLLQMKRDAYYIHKTAHGGVHVITCAQFDDFDYVRKLEEQDSRRFQKSHATNGKKAANKKEKKEK